MKELNTTGVCVPDKPKLFFIRHVKPQYPTNEKYYIGTTDLPLSEENKSEFEQASDFVSNIIKKSEMFHVYSSPLLRARQTASLIFGEKNVKIVHDLAEYNLGDWEGRRMEEIKALYPVEYRLRENVIGTDYMPNAEPNGIALSRFAIALEYIKNEMKTNNIKAGFIVGHTGIMKLYLKALGNKIHQRLEYGQIIKL